MTGDGGLEAFAFGLDAAAVAKLSALASADVPLAVALANPQEIFDWLPRLRGAGIRLARDFWPGPLILVSRLGVGSGLSSRLPSETRKILERPEGLPVRLAPRDDLTALFAAVPGPLVIASIRDAAAVDVVLDAPPESASEITVAAATERDVRILRQGAIGSDELRDSARCRVVFICTGNTCRSPMAEGLCRKLLADTLECTVGELGERGYEVGSAGMAAANGEGASPEAVDVARSHGADLRGHRSRLLTMDLVDRADFLFTMTTGHLRMLQHLHLPVGPEPQLLSPTGEDVPDPIGGPVELYQACAEQIRSSLRERLPQILEG